MVNKWHYLIYILVLLLIASMVALALFWDPTCENLYKIRSTKFEVEGVFYGYGEGRIDKTFDENQKCWDTSFSVDRKLYYTSGRWQGELPEVGTRIQIVSTTGLTKNVVITDVSTGRTYISGYSLQTPQP